MFSENGQTNGVNFVGLENLHQYMRQNRASILPFGAISIAVCSILPFVAMQPPSEDVQMQASGIGAPLDHHPSNASSDQRVTNESNSTTSSDEDGGLLQKNKNNKQRHQEQEGTKKSNLTKKAAHFAPFSGNKFKEVNS